MKKANRLYDSDLTEIKDMSYIDAIVYKIKLTGILIEELVRVEGMEDQSRIYDVMEAAKFNRRLLEEIGLDNKDIKSRLSKTDLSDMSLEASLITEAMGQSLNGYFSDDEVQENFPPVEAMEVIKNLYQNSIKYFSLGCSVEEYKELVIDNKMNMADVEKFLLGSIAANEKAEPTEESCPCTSCQGEDKVEKAGIKPASKDDVPSEIAELLKNLEEKTGFKASVFKITK